MTTMLRFMAAALALGLSGGCGTALYTLDPVAGPEVHLTEDQEAMTLTKGGLSVTVGPLGHLHGHEMRIGVLVRNNADKAVPVRLRDATVLVNGKPVRLMDQAEVDRLKRMDRAAGALSAASTSLAQSNVRNLQDPHRGTPDERRGDVEKTALEQGMQRSLAAQQTQNAALNAMRARDRLGREYAAKLAEANSVAWIDTYEVRSMTAQNIHLIDQHLWRDETLPPRSWVLRCLITDPGSVESILAGQAGRLEVQIELGGERFVYGFDAVARSLSEGNDEMRKRRARVMAVRGQ